MVFSSLIFLFYFLPIVMIAYFFSPPKVRNIIILVSGIVFYAWGEPFYILIMLLSTAIDYTAGRLIDKYDKNEKLRRLCLIVSVCVNLGLLSVFKYGSFFITNINALLGTNIHDPQLPLPIGISFYTFQSMSYTIDLYMRKIKVQKNFFSFAAYVTLFPQIVAGPIVRYEDVAKEIDDRSVTIGKVSEGIAVFLKGLGKKVLLANNIGLVWSQIKAMDYSSISALTAWIGILAFTFQIYFDFSGYSDMAVGLGKMLGFNFPKNFDHPYISKSVSEFWRRWHITLGAWFRSYVYIPLGGNRKGKARQIFNMFVVWALTGLWHGASWNFVLWGLYFFVLLVIEKLFLGRFFDAHRGIGRFCTLAAVYFGWIFFKFTDMSLIGTVLKGMFCFNGNPISTYEARSFALGYVLFFIIAVLACTPLAKNIGIQLKKRAAVSVAANAVNTVSAVIMPAFMFVLSCLSLVGDSYNPFLYFQF